eukprot:TRINITY_DN42853_c0_g1_i1.p1 TRINITY_DN42853_c0_g1~~TRINITY_DN42853_c0_g1_i1.p1  ORF type:complete len:552 (+),score=-12.33 TRINITY_DN42853_c0_g1_i1:307-1962(+)
MCSAPPRTASTDSLEFTRSIDEDEIQSVSEFLQEFAEFSAPRRAWTQAAGRDQGRPLRYVRQIMNAALAEALIPLVFMQAALQACALLAWCGVLVLVSLFGQPLVYRVVYWQSVFTVIILLFRQIDLYAWGESQNLWLCLCLLVGVLVGVLRGCLDYVFFIGHHASCGRRVLDIPLPFFFTCLYPIARLIGACLSRRRRIALRACWQIPCTLLGGIPFLAAHALMTASTFTRILDDPLAAGILICVWSLLWIPLRVVGKQCWGRLAPKQSLLLTVMWVSYVELAMSGFSLIVWMRKPVLALTHALTFGLVVAVNLVRGRRCLWSMPERGALMERLTLHFEVFASMFGRCCAYVLFSCFSIVRQSLNRSYDVTDELKRLDVYEEANIDFSHFLVSISGILFIFCIFVGYLVYLPVVWCPATETTRIVPALRISTTSVSENIVLGAQNPDAVYAEGTYQGSPELAPGGGPGAVSGAASQAASPPQAATCTLWLEGSKDDMALEQNRLLVVYIKRYRIYLVYVASFVFIQGSLLKYLIDSQVVWLQKGVCDERA